MHRSGVLFDAVNTILHSPTRLNPRVEAQHLLHLPSEEYVRNLVYAISADRPGLSEEGFVNALMERTLGHADDFIGQSLLTAWRNYTADLELQEGAAEVMRRCRDAGFQTAIVTNCTPFFRRAVEFLGLNDLVEAVYLSCDIGKIKPDPGFFDIVVSDLNLDASRTWVVGDKLKTDILGAKIAGCRSIYIEPASHTPYILPDLPIDAVVPRIGDVFTVLERLHK